MYQKVLALTWKNIYAISFIQYDYTALREKWKASFRMMRSFTRMTKCVLYRCCWFAYFLLRLDLRFSQPWLSGCSCQLNRFAFRCGPLGGYEHHIDPRQFFTESSFKRLRAFRITTMTAIGTRPQQITQADPHRLKREKSDCSMVSHASHEPSKHPYCSWSLPAALLAFVRCCLADKVVCSADFEAGW